MKTLKYIKEKAIPVLQSAGATRSALFGSYAQGTQNDDSDIDILVELPDTVSLLGFVRLKQELEEALDTSVDLVEYGTIKPALRDTILKHQLQLV